MQAPVVSDPSVAVKPRDVFVDENKTVVVTNSTDEVITGNEDVVTTSSAGGVGEKDQMKRNNSGDLDPIKEEPSSFMENKLVVDENKGTDGTVEWTNASTFKGSSFISTVINTVNTVIGAAIISIAYSIRISGVWGALVLMAVVLVPSLITIYYMACATVYTNEDIYGAIGRKLTNKVVGVLSDISLMVLDFGIDVAYMNVGFNQIEAIGRDVFNAGEFFTNNKTVGVSQLNET